MREIPKPSSLFEKWNLRPDVVYLNHGSFGATPRKIIDCLLELKSNLKN